MALTIPPSSTEVKERVELNLYPLPAFMAGYSVNFTFNKKVYNL
jgi:hypothetical protein